MSWYTETGESLELSRSIYIEIAERVYSWLSRLVPVIPIFNL